MALSDVSSFAMYRSDMFNPSPGIDSEHLELWHSTSPSWVFDLDTLAFLDANQAATSEYGYSRLEFLAMTVLDLSPGDDVVMHLRHVLNPRRNGQGADATWRHQKKDGSIVEVRLARYELTYCGRPAGLIVATPESTEPS